MKNEREEKLTTPTPKLESKRSPPEILCKKSKMAPKKPKEPNA